MPARCPPNPFRRRNTLSSSERTRMMASKTLMTTLNSRPCCYKNRVYTLNKGNIVRVKNNETLMKYTKGFYLLEKQCNTIHEFVNTVSEGLYSYIDMRMLDAVEYIPCDYNPLYRLDNCRILKGLIEPRARMNPTHKERIFQYPIPIKKITDCSCALPPCNNCTPPKIHDICGNICHHHYFPANSRIIYYSHQHDHEDHPDPYPHPNYASTNKLSLFSYLKQTSNQRCCEELPRIKTSIVPYTPYEPCKCLTGVSNYK